MKAYLTKYALTEGIKEVEVYGSDDQYISVKNQFKGLYFYLLNWDAQLTHEAAVPACRTNAPFRNREAKRKN